MQITYTTITDYITAVVAPALAGAVGRWDNAAVGAIAEESLIEVDGGYIENPDIEEDAWWEIAGKHMLSDDLVAADYGTFHAYDGTTYIYIQITDGEYAGTEWEEEILVKGNSFGKPRYEPIWHTTARLFEQVRASGWEFHNEPEDDEYVAYLIPPASA